MFAKLYMSKEYKSNVLYIQNDNAVSKKKTQSHHMIGWTYVFGKEPTKEVAVTCFTYSLDSTVEIQDTDTATL